MSLENSESYQAGCQQVLVRGKNKNKICGKECDKSERCFYHHLHRGNDTEIEKQIGNEKCKHILLTGNRKGKKCGKPADNGEYCPSCRKRKCVRHEIRLAIRL